MEPLSYLTMDKFVMQLCSGKVTFYQSDWVDVCKMSLIQNLVIISQYNNLKIAGMDMYLTIVA